MSNSQVQLQKVFGYIDEHADDIIRFLSKMISFPSVNMGTPESGEELEIQNWLRDQFQAFGQTSSA